MLLFIAMLIDALLVFSKKKGFLAERQMSDRFSIGDLNKVKLVFTNLYSFPVRISVIDELPFQFQERKWMRKLHFSTGITRFGVLKTFL